MPEQEPRRVLVTMTSTIQTTITFDPNEPAGRAADADIATAIREGFTEAIVEAVGGPEDDGDVFVITVQAETLETEVEKSDAILAAVAELDAA